MESKKPLPQNMTSNPANSLTYHVDKLAFKFEFSYAIAKSQFKELEAWVPCTVFLEATS